MIHAAVFDFDLTLADSTAGAVECVNHALLRMGLPPADRAEIRSTIGLSLPRIFATFVGTSDPAKVAEFSHWFVERAEDVMADLTVMFPQVPGTLAMLRRSGIRAAIVSTKFRYRIEGILAREKLVDAFDVIVGGEDVTQHKPDPEGLKRALVGLNVGAAESVYLGDHPVDAEAAHRAGVCFIPILSGSSVKSDFAEYQIAHFLSSLEELPRVLHAMSHIVRCRNV